MKTLLLLFCAALFAALSAPAMAQATFTTFIETINHGGWSLDYNLGANRGDEITLEVTCKRAVRRLCLIDYPRLNGVNFELLKPPRAHHQRFRATSPTTGDQFIHADYLGIGPDWLYHIVIIAAEPLR
jgi:hypothetical protein